MWGTSMHSQQQAATRGTSERKMYYRNGMDEISIKKMFHTLHLALTTASEGIMHKRQQFNMRPKKTKKTQTVIIAESERILKRTLLPFSKLKLKHLLSNQISTHRTSRTEVWCLLHYYGTISQLARRI